MARVWRPGRCLARNADEPAIADLRGGPRLAVPIGMSIRSLLSLAMSLGLAAPASAGPAKPSPVAYSPEAAAELIARLGECFPVSHCNPPADPGCPVIQTLAGFGERALPDLFAALADPDSRHREVILDLVARSTRSDVGVKLVALADGMAADLDPGPIYRAGAAIGGTPAFDRLVASYGEAMQSSETWRQQALTGGLRRFPAQTIAWASARLSSAQQRQALATLIADVATAGELAELEQLITTTRDPMVVHRLARAAIELGSDQWRVFLVGLRSRNAGVAADARAVLASISVPATRAAAFRAAIERGLAKQTYVLDRDVARSLVDLGSRNPRVLRVLFDGLASDRPGEQRAALSAIRRYADAMPAAMRSRLVAELESALARASGPHRQQLEYALGKLAASPR